MSFTNCQVRREACQSGPTGKVKPLEEQEDAIEYEKATQSNQAAMEKAWHLRVSECHAPFKAIQNHTTQNTVEIGLWQGFLPRIAILARKTATV